ncbi:hypothetical protein F511_46119 [Dorcoceras hygrometricum]|uniref:Uncharacterized protein n=1 Tax=Dorcoceras hygrometricum TaxID=472368 RepID=A0A2Z7A1N4_9LAMI|nr:hypothetical protein F511_46119 [Dorcoceras hygrometricum]
MCDAGRVPAAGEAAERCCSFTREGTRRHGKEAAACATLAGHLARLLRDDVRLAARLRRWRAPLRRAQNSFVTAPPPAGRRSGDVPAMS